MSNLAPIIPAVNPPATIILPPGSTGADLQAAIDNSASGDVIAISSDVAVTAAVTIAAGKAVTILSSAGSVYSLNQAQANIRHFVVSGSLSLYDLAIYGNDTGGGVSVNASGILTINGGVNIHSCRAGNGGGVYASGNGARVYMHGGTVSGNTATSGGGIYAASESELNMDGGAVTGNTASGDGGGIGVSQSVFNLHDGALISQNTITGKNSEGAGVFVDMGELNFYGGTVDGNNATGTNSFGGGVSIIDSDMIMRGGTISGNAAADGGGVSTDNSSFIMEGGYIVSNTAKGGGTVTVIGVGDVGTFGGRGGGVMDNFFSMCSMTGGEISGNRSLPGINETGLNGFNGPSKGGGIYVYYGSELALIANALVTGNTADRGGGIGAVATSVSSNTITIDGSAAISGNSAEHGGGLCLLVGHTSYTTYAGSNILLMGGDAIIGGNAADLDGGGIYAYGVNTTPEGTKVAMTMSGNAAISDNKTGRDGGGAYMGMVTHGTATITLDMYGNAAITGNSCEQHGGGAYVFGVETPSSGINLNNSASVAFNTAQAGDGGGLRLMPDAFVNAADAAAFTGNRAPQGNGGGINTGDLTYRNIVTSPDTVFSSNLAASAYAPPPDAANRYPNIGFASVSVAGHPLNNYDINFTEGEPLAVYVTYDANGGEGGFTGPGVSPGSAYTVLSPADTGISRANYDFTGWNTSPDGSGAAFQPGDTLTLDGDMTLYAQWTPVEPAPPEPPVTLPCCEPDIYCDGCECEVLIDFRLPIRRC